MDKTDFVINQCPVSICFVCPHYGEEPDIPWDEVNAPDYWGDDWGEVECPYCEKSIKLGICEVD